jgi:hypothetical protein
MHLTACQRAREPEERTRVSLKAGLTKAPSPPAAS